MGIGRETADKFLELYKGAYGHLPTLEEDKDLLTAMNLITLYDNIGWFDEKEKRKILESVEETRNV